MTADELPIEDILLSWSGIPGQNTRGCRALLCKQSNSAVVAKSDRVEDVLWTTELRAPLRPTRGAESAVASMPRPCPPIGSERVTNGY